MIPSPPTKGTRFPSIEFGVGNSHELLGLGSAVDAKRAVDLLVFDLLSDWWWFAILWFAILQMGVSKNSGFSPKSSILIGFSIIFTIHFGVPLFLETPKYCKFPRNISSQAMISPPVIEYDLKGTTLPYTSLGGGLNFLKTFTPGWGNDPIWRAYFSDALV